MKVFLCGVACVGKSTIGARLAELLGYPFFDLDVEIETFFGTSIPHLRQRWLTPYSFRTEAAEVLKRILSQERSRDCVIALPPSGLMDSYWKVVKASTAVVMVLQDEPENILKRIAFYDDESRPILKNLTDREKRLYLREIKSDVTYYKRTYRRASTTVDIAGLGVEESAQKLKDVLDGGLSSGVVKPTG